MNCLAQKRKFKNKEPVWLDPIDGPKKVIYDDEEKESKKTKGDVTSDEDSSDDDCDMYANDIKSHRISLETKELKFKHHVHINTGRSFQGQIKQVQFHPKSRLALVAYKTGQADLYEVDGERNNYIQNIKMPRTNVPYCAFTQEGDSVVITSEKYKGNIHVYDMMSSKIQSYHMKVGKIVKNITDFIIHGDHMACRQSDSPEVLILNTKTYEIESTIIVNEPVKAIRFTGTNDIIIAGENSQTYIWDLRKTSMCKNKFIDEGTLHITALDVSERSQQLTVGSETGMINIYELEHCFQQRNPTPIKTLCNLKSSIDVLKYNPTGELLLMGSSAHKNGFRLVHAHSTSVYKNLPVQGKRYGHLNCGDFSPLSGYLALGCSTGRAQLVRIPYYESY